MKLNTLNTVAGSIPSHELHFSNQAWQKHTGAQLIILPNRRPNLGVRAYSQTFAPHEKKKKITTGEYVLVSYYL